MAQYAIRFEFDSTNQGKKEEDYALKKELAGGGAVVYLALACPVHYLWQDDSWEKLDERPKYKLADADTLIYVFNDAAATRPGGERLPKVSVCGVSIEFAQSLAPFDDDVTASIRMSSTDRGSDFPIAGGAPLWVFTLDWTSALQNQPPLQPSVASPGDGFPFESAGKFDYSVSLLTFFEGGKADPKRYWQDPEMDIGN